MSGRLFGGRARALKARLYRLLGFAAEVPGGSGGSAAPDLRERMVREVMRPRTEVVALPLSASDAEVREVLRRARYSRYPVFGGSLDDIVGVFLAKDLPVHEAGPPFALARHLRETLFVPDTRPARRVLDDLRKTRAHVAIVLDEFGGTAGIVTLEDLVEEVVADVDDEYDVALRRTVESDGAAAVPGRRGRGVRVVREQESGDAEPG